MGEERLDPAQVRAARVPGWSRSQLARKADISFPAIRRMEISTAKDRNEAPAPVRQAFELQGVRFLRGGKGRISVGLGVNHSHEWDGFFHTPANDYDGLAARAGCVSGSILIWSRPFILAA